MQAVAATTMSVAMIAAFVLIGFGARFVFKPDTRKNGALMIVAGLVILGNVVIWTV